MQSQEVGEDLPDSYYITESALPEDSDDDFSYEEIAVEHFNESDGEEDFLTANRAANETKKHSELSGQRSDQTRATLSKKPEVVEDFVKNFLVELGMLKTLESFQTEWHELSRTADPSTQQPLSDCYNQNRGLQRRIEELVQEVNSQREGGVKAGEVLVRVRKERDFHRMHHKRLIQEKQKLIEDLKRLKQHYAKYPPTLSALREKYEGAVRDRMLTRLERDRAVGQVISLQATVKSLHGSRGGIPTDHSTRAVPRAEGDEFKEILLEDKQQTSKLSKESEANSTRLITTTLNPYADKELAPCGHLTKTAGFHLSAKTEAHTHGLSDISIHPEKPVLVTGSDDHTWKLWTLPEIKLIMSGEGHHDWISSCRFHPSGHRLATGSGDSSVKIWDFSKGSCVLTLSEHTHSIWSLSWHWGGDFLVSGSQDHHIKAWDVQTGACLSTLRGHSEAVTCVQFLPYSQEFVSSSADKRVALWDARNGLCVQSYAGHAHSVNWCSSDLRGTLLASCDSFGQVNLWDLRKQTLMETVDFGPHMANRLAFDSGSACLAVALGSGVVKMYNIAQQVVTELSEHEDSVQCLCFQHDGEYIVSGCSEGFLYLWS